MKPWCIVLGVTLLAGVPQVSFAQGGGGCRASGGMAQMRGEGTVTMTGSGSCAIEMARRQLIQSQQQEFARLQIIHLNHLVSEQAQLEADMQTAQRLARLDAVKKRRADELARRQTNKARNLARRQASTQEVAAQTRTLDIPSK
jgi:hypothetical protein